MTTNGRVLWVACDPTVFDGATKFSIALPRQRVIQPKPKPIIPGPPWTLGKEVDVALKEWYRVRGEPVPPDEIGIGEQIDAATAVEEEKFLTAVAAAEEELPSVVPPFGTPEFWDYHRKKKEIENKRRAAAGLPPLPTKKELEAEKEKKRAAKAAAKADPKAAAKADPKAAAKADPKAAAKKVVKKGVTAIVESLVNLEE